MAATPSRKLLDSVKRSKSNKELPLPMYDMDSMRTLKDECNTLYKEILELMDGGDAQLGDLDDGVKAALVVHHQTILRNKQCALLYLRERLRTLTRLRLEAGLVIPDEIRSNCGPEEKDFFAEYDALYAGYSRDLGLDLRQSLRPPKDLFIMVRAVADCGELVTRHSGVVRLDKGTSHFLRAADVEQLISQGMLEHVV